MKLPPLALAYHGIGSVPLRDDPHRLFASPAALHRHVARLRSFGYRMVTARELALRARGGDGEGHAALTFDDGLADGLAALLGRLGVPATLFATTGWLGAAHPDTPHGRVADRRELRALHAAGVEIGAHTVNHPDLTRLDFADCLAELVESRRELETIIDAPVESLAYPYGAADARVVAAADTVGYRWAWRVAGAGSWDAPRELPRQTMLNRCSTLGLWLKRTDRYEAVVGRPLIRAARQARLRALGHRRPHPRPVEPARSRRAA